MFPTRTRIFSYIPCCMLTCPILQLIVDGDFLYYLADAAAIAVIYIIVAIFFNAL
jgi:hypothetical protein